MSNGKSREVERMSGHLDVMSGQFQNGQTLCQGQLRILIIRPCSSGMYRHKEFEREASSLARV